MRKLLVLVSAVLALVIAAPAAVASAATATAPVGALESAVSNPVNSTVVMTGWALDRSARSATTSVLVTVDGVASGGWRVAGVARADVNRSQSATGGHGFSITLAPKPGKHVICVETRLRSGAQVTSLGCFSFTAYRMATAADVSSIAKTIDPQHTIAWQWTALPAGTLGQALPWNGQVRIASGQTIQNLRDVMIHEWSHVLQYRAFGGSWWDAVQAFNALLGHPADRSSYSGIEHGADCIAQALGAGYLGYGCSPALRTYGALIARGVLMTTLRGTAQVTMSGSTATVSGWTVDPRRAHHGEHLRRHRQRQGRHQGGEDRRQPVGCEHGRRHHRHARLLRHGVAGQGQAPDLRRGPVRDKRKGRGHRRQLHDGDRGLSASGRIRCGGGGRVGSAAGRPSSAARPRPPAVTGPRPATR